MTKKKSEWFFGLSGKANLVISLVFVLVFCFLDQLIPGKTPVIPNFVKYIAVNGLIYAIASLGINFYSGYLGETSLGHAAFYGIGAYMTGYLTTKFGVSFWLTLPLGMLAAAAASVPVALAGRRVKGSLMVVITYAFCEILRYIVINTDELGGTAGIPGIKPPTILGMKITKMPFLPSNKDGYILILYAIVVFLAAMVIPNINSILTLAGSPYQIRFAFRASDLYSVYVLYLLAVSLLGSWLLTALLSRIRPLRRALFLMK